MPQRLQERIRAEYLEMPGLRLTIKQAQRLCHVDEALCRQVFSALVEEQFLVLRPNGIYVRATEGAESPRRR